MWASAHQLMANLDMQAWLRSLKPRKTSGKVWDRMLDAAVQRRMNAHDRQALNETLQAWNAICSHVQPVSGEGHQVISAPVHYLASACAHPQIVCKCSRFSSADTATTHCFSRPFFQLVKESLHFSFCKRMSCLLLLCMHASEAHGAISCAMLSHSSHLSMQMWVRTPCSVICRPSSSCFICSWGSVHLQGPFCAKLTECHAPCTQADHEKPYLTHICLMAGHGASTGDVLAGRPHCCRQL